MNLTDLSADDAESDEARKHPIPVADSELSGEPLATPSFFEVGLAGGRMSASGATFPRACSVDSPQRTQEITRAATSNGSGRNTIVKNYV